MHTSMPFALKSVTSDVALPPMVSTKFCGSRPDSVRFSAAGSAGCSAFLPPEQAASIMAAPVAKAARMRLLVFMVFCYIFFCCDVNRRTFAAPTRVEVPIVGAVGAATFVTEPNVGCLRPQLLLQHQTSDVCGFNSCRSVRKSAVRLSELRRSRQRGKYTHKILSMNKRMADFCRFRVIIHTQMSVYARTQQKNVTCYYRHCVILLIFASRNC